MNKQNQGFTLVEIIVSISLISIIMLFLFRLLLIVQSEDALNNDRSNINVVTSLLISEIQDDFLTKEIKYMYKPVCVDSSNPCCCQTGSTDCLKMYYKTGETQELSVYQTNHFNDSIRYGSVSRVLPTNFSFLSSSAYNMASTQKFSIDEIGQGQYLSVPAASPLVDYDVDSLLTVKIPLYLSTLKDSDIEIRSTYSCQYINTEFGTTDCKFVRPTCP